MFKQKQASLIEAKPKKTSVVGITGNTLGNSFVNAGLKKAAKTLSGNGALKYSTTGNSFVDEFGKAAGYKAPRSFDEISRSMSTLWAESAEKAIKFLFYLRIITRVIVLPDGSKTETTQRGQGLRHEGIFRMMWVAINHPDVFWENINLFISVGSWKDIITMLSYDLQYNGWKGRVLDWDSFGQLILAGLENPGSVDLIKKYLPQIKANSACKTVEAQADNIIAKWIGSLLFGGKIEDGSGSTYKRYRKLKTSGAAHEWQKLISTGNFLKINFDSIHGRALAQLVSGKFLANVGLEAKYQKWIETKPVAKYTGYVYELMGTLKNVAAKKYQIDTINKQFMNLVEVAKNGARKDTSLIVVRDTSSSMGSPAPGTKVSCFDVAKSLALFFSYMLPEGRFANAWIEFNSTAQMHEWKGSTPVERWNNDHSSYVGSTNFQSVINLLATIKKQGVAESEFPTGILCISDSEFNPAALAKTNVEKALETLRKAGFSEDYVSKFQIVLWNLQNSYYGKGSGEKFETFGEAKNVFYMSGLDGSTVAFLTGQAGKEAKVPTSDVELFEAAMDQEVLNLVKI